MTSQQIELRAESDVKREPGKLYLPLLQCADCHTTGWLSRLPSGQSKLSTDLDEIYNTWFSGQPEALRLYSSAGLSRPLCDGIMPSGYVLNVAICKAAPVSASLAGMAIW